MDMQKKKLPIGIDNFEKLRLEDFLCFRDAGRGDWHALAASVPED